jgi:eukaryotic-like serine/threonine-protein kinase
VPYLIYICLSLNNSMKYLFYVIILVSLLPAISCKKSNPGGGGGGTAPSTNKSITSFAFKASDNAGLAADIAGVVSADSVVIALPYGTSITSLKPTVQHNGISVTPVSGAVQNFSSPVTYTVKAEDGSTKNYLAVVKIQIKSTVYAGSADGKLYAFDGDDGTLKWTYTTGGAINGSSPTYYNGTVFVGSADGYLHAVNATTGALKWKYSARGDISNTTPALNNGILYFGSGVYGLSYLTAINANTGALIWEKTNFVFFASPTWYSGRLYAGGVYGLYSFNTLDGSILSTLSSDISRGNPLAVNNVLYAAGESSIVTAFNTATGGIKWSYSDGGPNAGSRGGPTLFNGIVYNMGFTQYMYAIDSATGVLRWKYTDGSAPGLFSSASVANGLVYSCNNNSYIYALDAASGALRWKFSDGVGVSLPNTPDNNCTVKNDMVYSGSYSKKLYALNALTGAVKWQYTTGGIISGGPCIVAEDGSVYHSGISGEHQ